MKNLYKITGILLVAIVAAGFIAGCATTSGGGETRPGWVDTPPSATSEAFYFVGSGSDPAGNEAAARQLASSQLLSEITRFLGVKVSSETTVEAKDAYGKFESSVSQKINEQSSAQIGDLIISDVYTDTTASGVNVFLLAEYDKGALLEEKARLEAVFAEQVEAISGPEKEGQELMTRGEFSHAAVKYMEAALAAVTSSVDNAEIKFERNINNAKDAISRIRLIGLNDNITGLLGQPLDSSFMLKATGGEDADAPGLSGVAVRVFYKAVRRNGRMGTVTESYMTDGGGIVDFTRPAASFTGEERLIMSLDMSAPLEPLQNLPGIYLDQIDGLEQVIGQKKVTFNYSIVSMAREVPTAVFVTDLDRSRNPLGGADTTAGILEILSGDGFMVSGLPANHEMSLLSDEALRHEILNAYGDTYSRVIVGSGEISSFEESDGAYLVQVAGTLKAIDLETGIVLYSTSQTKRARGQSETGIISQAFKSLGKILAEDMANNLP